MIKQFGAALFVFSAIWLALYLVGVFAAADFDMSAWPEPLRGFLGFALCVFGLPVSATTWVATEQ